MSGERSESEKYYGQRMAASRAKLTDATVETMKAAMENIKKMENIITAALNGEDTINNGCRKNGYIYPTFLHYLQKLAKVGRPIGYKPELPRYMPTVAETIYSNVFGVPVDEVAGMMPDDAEESLDSVLGTFSERTADIVRRRACGETIESIGNSYGVSRERIRQIEAKAYRMMRHPSRQVVLKLGLHDKGQAEAEIAAERAALVEQYKEKLRYLDSAYVKAKNALEKETIKKMPALEDVSLADMDLSVRSFNCLRRAGIRTVADFVGYDYDKLAAIRNLGRKSVNEIIRRLEDYGVYIMPKGDA